MPIILNVLEFFNLSKTRSLIECILHSLKSLFAISLLILSIVVFILLFSKLNRLYTNIISKTSSLISSKKILQKGNLNSVEDFGNNIQLEPFMWYVSSVWTPLSTCYKVEIHSFCNITKLNNIVYSNKSPDVSRIFRKILGDIFVKMLLVEGVLLAVCRDNYEYGSTRICYCSNELYEFNNFYRGKYCYVFDPFLCKSVLSKIIIKSISRLKLINVKDKISGIIYSGWHVGCAFVKFSNFHSKYIDFNDNGKKFIESLIRDYSMYQNCFINSAHCLNYRHKIHENILDCAVKFASEHELSLRFIKENKKLDDGCISFLNICNEKKCVLLGNDYKLIKNIGIDNFATVLKMVGVVDENFVLVICLSRYISKLIRLLLDISSNMYKNGKYTSSRTIINNIRFIQNSTLWNKARLFSI